MQDIERLPLWKQIMFAMGQFGWSLAAFGVGNLIMYFYMPPETGESMIPPLIFQGTFFLIFTVLGLANMLGRLFDAITDPIIAGLTDRSTNRFGRRRIFLLLNALPVAIFSVMVFMPPSAEPCMLNSIWVIGAILLFYLFLTLYVVPYGALIAELGHTSKERMILATLVSVTWALGFAVGQMTWEFKSMLEGSGMSPMASMQTIVAIFAVIAFICMMLPVIFIDEHRYCKKHISNEGTFEAVRNAFKNKDFVMFTMSDFCYFIANTFLEMGIVYYVTVLMGLEEAMTTTLMMSMFILSFAFYPIVIKVVDRVGKKKVLLSAFFMQVFVYLAIPFAGSVPGVPAATMGWCIILFEAIPVAIFGIVPTAIIADIAKSDGIRTGNFKEAIFFAARSFVMKLAISTSALLFPWLLSFGKSIDNPFGVQLTAGLGLVFSIIGGVILLYYGEANINAELAKEEPEIEGEIAFQA